MNAPAAGMSLRDILGDDADDFLNDEQEDDTEQQDNALTTNPTPAAATTGAAPSTPRQLSRPGSSSSLQ